MIPNKNRLPGRPGNIKMKCLIWGNQPVASRVDQNEAFVLSHETLKALPDYIKNAVSSGDGVQGVWLREKIVYHNNFITAGKQLFESMRTDMQAYFNPKKLPDLEPLDAETPHFMWTLEGSLFDPNIVTPEQLINNDPVSLDPSKSKWTHEVVNVPRNTSDGLASLLSSAINTVSSLLGGTAPKKLPDTQRFFPSQGAVSSATRWVKTTGSGGAGATAGGSGTGGTSTTQQPKGVHWKATKNTKLFQGEDFFVEFRKRAYAADALDTKDSLDPRYIFLDARANAVSQAATATTAAGTFVVNAGVVDVDKNNQIVDESRATLDFNAQPYYIIEMGHGTEHNYLIILAKNAQPRFVHVSDLVPVLSIDPTNGITMQVPPQKCSRVLSIYDGVTTKHLMDNDEILRVQVRQHMGLMVVTFSGQEHKPWVISREDPVVTAGSDEWSSDPKDYEKRQVPMLIAPAPVSIYGGNMKVAWSFGPIQYEEKATIMLPQAIVVKGPVSKPDVSLRLAELATYSGVTDEKKKFLYNQDAEEYHETVKGHDNTIIKQFEVQPDVVKQRGKAPDKAQHPTNGLTNSSISIVPRTQLSAVGSDPNAGAAGGAGNVNTGVVNTGGTTVNGTNQQSALSNSVKMAQAFYAEYSMAAGDYEFAPDPANGATKKWRVKSCITPVATGWRLFVPAGGCAKMPEVIDVAHHVTAFSDSWSAQDLHKIDHSGQITFLITPGQTGHGKPDYSARLAALHDKTFYIRIYAWWEDGFMACLPGCDCNGCSGCDDANCIFTGLCHGGQITTDNGKKTMDCQLLDYWKILQDMAFINSPIFDGMRDFNAVYLILKLAGLRDGTEAPIAGIGGTPVDHWAPAALVKTLADSDDDEMTVPWPSNSCVTAENVFTWSFALPSAYDVLQSPNMKFQDGTKMEEAIVQIAAKAGKVCYFDRWGVFHYENRKEEQIQFQGADPLTLCDMNFYASPKDFPTELCTNTYQQVIGNYNYKANVGDVFNIIHVLTTTPDGQPAFADDVNYASIHDPTQNGYIGYRKMFYQQNGIFGSLEAATKAVQTYSAFFKSPLSVSFSSFGNGRLRALQLVSFSGLQIDATELNKQPFRLTSVASTMEPQGNMWTTKYDAEWQFFHSS